VITNGTLLVTERWTFALRRDFDIYTFAWSLLILSLFAAFAILIPVRSDPPTRS
jgi:hypothetical protein